MKKVLFIVGFIVMALGSNAQNKFEFQQITTVESVVPGGLGRSRMISTAKDGTLEETKLENFFSLVGINFGNIKDNDKAITDKIEKMTNDGWELFSTTTGVYGPEGGSGIFITRYLFKRPKK